MGIVIKRVYAPAQAADGYRVLVDRLWPRGFSKASLKMDAWLKEVSPSTELRHRFHHDESKWPEFEKAYFKELDKQPDGIAALRKRARTGRVTLLYAARNEIQNNAVALKKYLERKSK